MLNRHDEIIDVYHGTSKRVNHVIHTTNLLVLATYFPTQTFDSPKLNQPLAQFIYNRGKRSPFMTREDAAKLTTIISRVVDQNKRSPGMTGTHELSFGLVEVGARGIKFPFSGERYSTFDRGDSIEWLRTLVDALNTFINQERGDEYPFKISNRYENGVSTDSIFAYTHHGDESYGQVPSFLRYTHSTNGLGGAMTIQYGLTQMHIGSSHTRGVDWLEFLEKLLASINTVATIMQTDERFVRERFYEGHPLLDPYNCYVSAVRESRGVLMTINTDLSIVNTKASFVVKESNLKQLHTFLKTIIIYLKSKEKK